MPGPSGFELLAETGAITQLQLDQQSNRMATIALSNHFSKSLPATNAEEERSLRSAYKFSDHTVYGTHDMQIVRKRQHERIKNNSCTSF